VLQEKKMIERDLSMGYICGVAFQHPGFATLMVVA
jgi:hypothetical protein